MSRQFKSPTQHPADNGDYRCSSESAAITQISSMPTLSLGVESASVSSESAPNVTRLRSGEFRSRFQRIYCHPRMSSYKSFWYRIPLLAIKRKRAGLLICSFPLLRNFVSFFRIEASCLKGQLGFLVFLSMKRIYCTSLGKST